MPISSRVAILSGVSLDPDAKAYANAVSAVGGVLSGAQKKLISDFVKAEKAANRWSSHKRIFLPIYGAAAPSAIDLVTGLSGSFTASGVTHAAGYVQGDGATGYFNANIANDALFSTSSGYIGVLQTAVATVYTNAPAICGGSGYQIQSGTSICIGTHGNKALTATAPKNGIVLIRHNGTGIRFTQRITAGYSDLVSDTQGTIGPQSGPTLFLARNVGSSLTPSYISNVCAGVFFAGTGQLSDANSVDFTLNLKNLWEGLTGLTLP